MSDSNKVHIDEICDKIRYYIEKLENYSAQLPVQDVSVSKGTIHKLSDNASNTLWKNAFNTYRNIVSSYGSNESSTNLLLRKLSEFAKENDKADIKVGIISGAAADLDTIKEYASIPSRDGLLTMLAGGMIQYVKELSIGLNMYAEQLEK